MTSEAQEYLRKLIQEDPDKVFEMTGDSERGLSSVILNIEKLTFQERVEIRYLIDNGSPSIVMERRISMPPKFEKGGITFKTGHEEEFPGNVVRLDHFKDALKYSSTYQEIIHAGIEFGKIEEDISEVRLREKLKEEEAKENYEMCAEILKYAESKGINL